MGTINIKQALEAVGAWINKQTCTFSLHIYEYVHIVCKVTLNICRIFKQKYKQMCASTFTIIKTPACLFKAHRGLKMFPTTGRGRTKYVPCILTAGRGG